MTERENETSARCEMERAEGGVSRVECLEVNPDASLSTRHASQQRGLTRGQNKKERQEDIIAKERDESHLPPRS